MKIDWKERKTQLLLLLLTGVLLVVITMPEKEKESYGAAEKEAGKEYMETGYSEKAYEAEIERKLENILQEIEGAGMVKVMVTFQSSSEKIVEKDQERSSQTVEENDKQEGTKKTDDRKSSEATVYRNASGGEEIPYVTKEIKPKVEGVVVLAQGGGNAVVVKNITEAVQALFDVDTHKIKVMKRNQTN